MWQSIFIFYMLILSISANIEKILVKPGQGSIPTQLPILNTSYSMLFSQVSQSYCLEYSPLLHEVKVSYLAVASDVMFIHD